MAAKKRFYAVRNGRTPGIYKSWKECEAQVRGFSNAEFEGFLTLSEAKDYLKQAQQNKSNEERAAPKQEVFKGLEPIPLLVRDSRSLKQVVMYTDGACTGNPGPGGYGVVLIYGERRKELSAGFRLTTNNRMEILACVAGLQELKEPCDVTIYSDSKYVVDSITKSWALKWRKRGWKRIDKDGQEKDAINADLWARMLDLCDKHRVRFQWVRGHDGNEGNERCDHLARTAAATDRFGRDVEYESGRKGAASVSPQL
jgi:ribonuclease HI